MPLSLETAQTLALGSFNPHIITPEWLVQNKVCEDAEVEIRFIPLSQGLAFRIKDVQWQIDSRLLMVESRKANCGDFVSEVVRLLPHTPIRAVGNNFHYACGKDDWGQGPLPMLGGRKADALDDLGSVEQTRWACAFRKEDVRVEVTVAEVIAAENEPGMAVLFNFHRETKNADQALTAARQFKHDSRWSQELLQRLFGQEVMP